LPLIYKDQATLVADVAWQKRIAAAVADVAQGTIQKLANAAPNEFHLKALAVRAVSSDELTMAFCRLVAAGFGATVSTIAAVPADTGTDQQLKTQVTDAFNALVSR